jgi:hypothetical protein
VSGLRHAETATAAQAGVRIQREYLQTAEYENEDDDEDE